MASPIVIMTAIESCFGFLLTSTILYLVLSRGRKAYHYLFAAFLLICVIWDLGIFLTMVRNQRVEELDIIGRIAIMPCTFIPALIFHFSKPLHRTTDQMGCRIGMGVDWRLVGADPCGCPL